MPPGFGQDRVCPCGGADRDRGARRGGGGRRRRERADAQHGGPFAADAADRGSAGSTLSGCPRNPPRNQGLRPSRVTGSAISRSLPAMSGAPAIPKHSRIGAAWLMLGGAFIAFTISAALMHSYPVYLVAFIEEFGWSRAETSIAYSVSQLVGGVCSPLVGVLVDRLGLRRLLLLGCFLLVLGLAASGFATEIWQMIVLYGVVMTLGANCLGLVAFVPLLSRHFVRRRGMAISIVQSSNGIARGVSAPLVQLLISFIGWRTTYLWQAGFMALCTLPLAAM